MNISKASTSSFRVLSTKFPRKMPKWLAKVGTDAKGDWQNNDGPICNAVSNERGLRLLEFASYTNLVLANNLAPHKASRRWTWHSPNGQHHNQINYIMVQNRFRSSINRAQTRSFPGANVGSDHDMIMMIFRLRLKKIRRLKNIKYN